MRIGLIGLGNMGYPLLKKLIKNRYNVNVLIEKSNNIKLNKCNIFLESEINKFIDCSSMIISILPNSKVTLNLAKKISNQNEKFWMDLCSSCPDDVIQISDIMSNQNISYIDAPVSGGPNGMKNGNLATIISGPIKTYKKYYDIISLYSNNIFYISENIGVSSEVKLANNTMLGLNLISVAEVLNILEKKGINIADALTFINNSSGRSWVTMQRYPDNILNGKYNYGFSYNLHKKDILTFLNSKNIDDRFLLSKIRDIYKDKKYEISQDMDHTEITKLIK
tara:strand:- start:1110 stop:1949 length:840 start_codon:yes stop_codon:yes gene_type:complete